jgi:hypothetical protein
MEIMAKDESMKHENKESKKMESKETKLETKGYRETMSGKMKKTMKMKKGGIAKGCGAVLSNRRKKTKVY